MGFCPVHLYCAPIPFKLICHVLGNKIGQALICHASCHQHAASFAVVVRCIFPLPVFVASSGIGR